MHIMTDTHPSRYSEAGVDIDKGNAFVKGIKEIVASTHQTGVLNDIGGGPFILIGHSMGGIVIAEAARVVKPGGRVLLVDLQQHEQVELQQRFGQRWPGFASSDIEAWMTNAGLAETRVVSLPPEAKARGPLLLAAAARKHRIKVRNY